MSTIDKAMGQPQQEILCDFPIFSSSGHTERGQRPFKSVEAYRYLFSGGSNEKTIGEVSPTYLYSRRAATAILAHVPDAKLIVSLRNPIDRTASVYSMLSGSDKGKRPLKEALQNDTELVRSSMYYEHVRYYMKLYGKDKIKVLLFDALEADWLGVVRDVYRYLGVDDQFPPNVAVRHNPGTKTHSTIIRRVEKIYRSSARL
ncbi:MAG: sulfotransferase [Pseudomonadota bacterium]|nr:sulfotransferase [Pseudomonadota bacterium]